MQVQRLFGAEMWQGNSRACSVWDKVTEDFVGVLSEQVTRNFCLKLTMRILQRCYSPLAFSL